MDRHSTAMAVAAAWWLSVACRFSFPNHAGMANAAPPWHRGRNDRRRRGAVVPALVLILAAAMLLPTPKARAVDSFFASHAVSGLFCQLSTVESNDVFKLPELGGSYVFTPTGNYTEGLTVGKARLTGTIEIEGGSPVSTFAVDLVVEGRLDNGDDGYADACRSFLLRCGSADGWRVYTALSGTLTGKSGPFVGAVYNLSLGQPASACTFGLTTNPVFQVGFGANTHNADFGGFAPLNFELADDGGNPGLPIGPFVGELSLDLGLPNANFPTPSPDLTGTWEGSIDCAGIADFTDTESFSGPVVLKARQETFFTVGSAIERLGLTYSVELSDGAGGVIKTYCAEFAHDLQLNSNQGTGLMVGGDPATALSHVFLKVRKDPSDPAATLKARELILLPDGTDGDGLFESEVLPDGMNFCKWTFTQTDVAVPNPAIANVCPHPVCGNSTLDTPFEQCDDGNRLDGDGCSASCTIEP